MVNHLLSPVWLNQLHLSPDDTRCFERKDLSCIIISTQGYLNVLDPRRDKTAVQLYYEMAKDRDLFTKVFFMNKTYAQTERLLQTESLDDILELSKRFRLLVGGSAASAGSCVLSDLICFQFHCLLFWSRCACELQPTCDIIWPASEFG